MKLALPGRWRLIAVALFVVCASSQCFANEFGNLIYTVPEGWTEQKQQDALLLIPGDVPAGVVFALSLTKGSEMNGKKLRQFLDDALERELSTGAKLLNATPVTESKTAGGIPVLSTARLMATREGDNFLVVYFAMQAGTHGEMVTVLSNSKEVVQSYTEKVGHFIGALQFANLQKKKAPPSSP